MNKKERINQHGWMLIKNLYSPAEIETIRELGLQTQDQKGDVLSNEALKYILLDERLINILKEVLGTDEIVYFGDSSVSIEGKSHGFHKDSRDRFKKEGKEWHDIDYSIVRIGIYLQDHSKHSGGLCLRDQSHLNQSVEVGKILNVKSEVGDLVVWKLTTTHSGNADILALFPRLSLHPNIARRIPKMFLQDRIKPRMVIFSAFGKDDEFTHEYIEYLKTRTYAIDRWLDSNYEANQVEDFAKLNVKVIEVDKEELKKIKLSEATNDKFVQV